MEKKESITQGTFIINSDVTIEIVGTGIWFNDYLLDRNEAVKIAKLILCAFDLTSINL